MTSGCVIAGRLCPCDVPLLTERVSRLIEIDFEAQWRREYLKTQSEDLCETWLGLGSWKGAICLRASPPYGRHGHIHHRLYL